MLKWVIYFIKTMILKVLKTSKVNFPIFYRISCSRHPHSISDIVRQMQNMFPDLWSRIAEEIEKFKQSPLGKDHHFETLKERFLIIHSALGCRRHVSDETKGRLAQMVFTSEDLVYVDKFLQNSETSMWTYAKAVVQTVTSVAFPTSMWYRNAKKDANRTASGKFFAELPMLVENEPFLVSAAAQIGERYTPKLRDNVHSLASRWANLVSKAELDQLRQHLRLQATTLHNQDQSASRTKLLQDLRQVLAPDNSSQQVYVITFAIEC
jgi:hypothetical protein